VVRLESLRNHLTVYVDAQPLVRESSPSPTSCHWNFDPGPHELTIAEISEQLSVSNILQFEIRVRAVEQIEMPIVCSTDYGFRLHIGVRDSRVSRFIAATRAPDHGFVSGAAFFWASSRMSAMRIVTAVTRPRISASPG